MRSMPRQASARRCAVKTRRRSCALPTPLSKWIRASSVTPGGKENVACTFHPNTSTRHLAWSLPLYQPTYFTPSNYIHFFMMFAPFLASPGLQPKLFGAFLLLTGPVLAAWISPDLNEQASIWCFFSIVQIACMFGGVLMMGDDKKEKAAAPKSA